MGRKQNKDILIFIEENTNKHVCLCGCNQFIKIIRNHYYSGIPKYINYHDPVTELENKKRSESLKKYYLENKYSESAKEKIRIKNTGRKHSIETREKQSESRKKYINNGGKVWNDGLTKNIDERINSFSKRMEEYNPMFNIDTRLKNSSSQLERFKKFDHPFKGKHHTEESIKRMCNSHKGCISPMKGKHHTEESKIKNSIHNKGRIPPISSSRGKRSYYDSPLQGNICFRSSYELAYAKYLDSKNILWMYEIETFDLGDTTYTPDFFLPQFEKFIEIKGYMRSEAKKKIDKFLEQYPWDLEILRKDDLFRLGVL